MEHVSRIPYNRQTAHVRLPSDRLSDEELAELSGEVTTFSIRQGTGTSKESKSDREGEADVNECLEEKRTEVT